MEETFCHFPWTTLYIEPNGCVFSCCHKKPYILGDIAEQTLEDIFFGPECETVRASAMDGSLACFGPCNLPPKRRFYAAGNKPFPAPSPPALNEIHINISTRCNLRCVMCGQDHRSHEELDIKKLISGVDWTKRPRLIMQGGEPLVIPRAYELTRFIVNQTDSNFTLITNGTELSRKWIRLLTAGNNECRISLNGAAKASHETVNKGSSWKRVLKNVRKLASARVKKSSSMTVTLRMTVVPANVRELPLFVRFGNSEGYPDRLTFGFDKKALPKWINRNREEFTRIYHDFMSEINDSRVLCDSWRIFDLARKAGIEDRDLKYTPKGQLL